MSDPTTLPLCERTIGHLIILFDVLVIFYYFVVLRLRPACKACNQKVRAILLPCGSGNCYYCPACLNECITARCQSRTLWPIHCRNTSPLPLRHVRNALTEDTIKLVRRRVSQWGHPGGELYCAGSSCLTPLPRSQGPRTLCPECEYHTCRRCRDFAHIDSCRPDIGVLP